MGEHEHLVARTLDDHVQIALHEHRRRFERLAADGHRQHARFRRLDVAHRRQRDRDFAFQFLVLRVFGHLERERLVRSDQRNVELLHSSGQMHLAKIRLQVDRVNPHADLFDVAAGERQVGRLVAAEDARRGDRHALGRKLRDPPPGISDLRSPGDLAIFLERLFQFVELLFGGHADHVLGLRRFVGAGIFRDQASPIGNRRVPLFLLVIHLAEQVQNRSAAAVERILGQKGGPQIAGLGVILGPPLLVAAKIFGVDDLALSGGPLLVRRVLAQIFGPGGERLVVFLLKLIAAAEQVAGLGHFVALGVTLVLEKHAQRRNRVVITAAVDVAAGDVEMGDAGQLVLGILLQERAQGGDAECQIVVAAGDRHAVGLAQVVGGLGDALAFRISMGGEQIFPRATGGRVLPQGKLVLAETEAGFDQQLGAGQIALAVLLHENVVTAGRLGKVTQQLIAAGHSQLDLDAALWLGSDFESLGVKLQRLVVIGLLRLFGRLEVAVGKLQIDVGDLLLAILRE